MGIRELFLSIVAHSILASGQGGDVASIGKTQEKFGGSDMPEINLTVYYESHCPFCAKFEIDIFPSLYEQFKDVISYHPMPFGNAYFVTEECGGERGSPYDMEVRKCWNKTCGISSGLPMDQVPKDCYKSENIVCQHGDQECVDNRILGCALGMSISSSDMHYRTNVDMDDFVEFQKCFMDAIRNGDSSTWEICAEKSEYNVSDLKNCSDPKSSLGDRIRDHIGYMTPMHATVPSVLLNGSVLADESRLKAAICKIIRDTHHDGCEDEDFAGEVPSLKLAPGFEKALQNKIYV